MSLFKLARPLNLAIMVLTMVCLRYWIIASIMQSANIGMEFQLSEIQFTLLCCVVVLLAAAGNFINDYFDLKVDRINRPDRVIIGKDVKRRVAMILHQVLNIIAVLLTAYLCWKTQLWGGMIFTVVIATLLWWYSPILKKRAVIGNIVIAICAGLVPIWQAYFEINLLEVRYHQMLLSEDLIQSMWYWMIGYGFFAFILTLAREILKDIEDIEGDKTEHYHTLPINTSESFARYTATIILWVSLLAFLCVISYYYMHDTNTLIAAALLVVLPLVIGIKGSGSARKKEEYHRASMWVKAAMVGGILFAYFAGQHLAQLS
ncbi:MAG: geranylgeranylglycerol-phosphate geranylgeranyltransferase [Flavobacteriales bacterium]